MVPGMSKMLRLSEAEFAQRSKKVAPHKLPEIVKTIGLKPANKPKVVYLTEHQEQCKVIAWANQHPIAKYLHSTPNGMRTSIRTALKGKAEGLRAGYPDLSLDVARSGFYGLRIELKRVKGGTVSDVQRQWGQFLSEHGYFWKVCRGADEAIRVITDYLEG